MSSPEAHPPGTDPAVPVRDRLEAAKIVAVVRVPSPDGVVAACHALCRQAVSTSVGVSAAGTASIPVRRQ